MLNLIVSRTMYRRGGSVCKLKTHQKGFVNRGHVWIRLVFGGRRSERGGIRTRGGRKTVDWTGYCDRLSAARNEYAHAEEAPDNVRFQQTAEACGTIEARLAERQFQGFDRWRFGKQVLAGRLALGQNVGGRSAGGTPVALSGRDGALVPLNGPESVACVNKNVKYQGLVPNARPQMPPVNAK